MKKLVAAMLVLVLVLCAFAAYGEEGDGLPEKELGDGSTTLLVYVASGSVDTDALFFVYTDETNLLDALLGVGLIDGEEASWGFNVTTVNGKKADYDKNGEYWRIYRFDEEEEDWVSLETSLKNTPVQVGGIYGFEFCK